VVWQGSAGDRRPYADFIGYLLPTFCGLDAKPDRVECWKKYQGQEGSRSRSADQCIGERSPKCRESERDENFSQILPGTVISDFSNNQPFANNILPASRLDPISIGLLQYYPVPNQPGSSLVNNYLALDNNVTNKDQFTTRSQPLASSPHNSRLGRGRDGPFAVPPSWNLFSSVIFMG
jgi:hypothetical protein